MERGGEAIASGIEGMRERAMLVGANLEIDSRPGAGTRVRLVVPVETGRS
jgi:two-component system sensor histidine kinase UhpB